MQSFEDLSEGFLPYAHEADPFGIFTCLIPTPGPGHGANGNARSIQGSGEAATDFAHADDVDAGKRDINHRNPIP
jgi:hypothetical protein